MAEKSWQKIPSALSREIAALARETRACSYSRFGGENLPSQPYNEPVKLTAEIFMEANGEQ
jgi:hypothetical protein